MTTKFPPRRHVCSGSTLALLLRVIHKIPIHNNNNNNGEPALLRRSIIIIIINNNNGEVTIDIAAATDGTREGSKAHGPNTAAAAAAGACMAAVTAKPDAIDIAAIDIAAAADGAREGSKARGSINAAAGASANAATKTE